MRATLWRWHFYAGLFCVPFVLLLSTSGLVYLFKPQIDGLIDARYERLAPLAGPHDPAREVAAALAAVPGATFSGYELPRTDRSAVRVLLSRRGVAWRTYVDPTSFRVLKTVREEARFERLVFRFHGALLLGNAGSVAVELAASWAIVMILTGLALFVPGPARAAGLLYPRLRAGGRRFWRDLHGVCGLWCSLVILFLLVSGLPWSYAWGNYLKAVRALAGVTQHADWAVGAAAPRETIASGMPDMADTRVNGPAVRHTPVDLVGLAPVLRTAARLGLADPVVVTPPRTSGGPWHARSDAEDRVLRTVVTLAPDGRILARAPFSARPLIDRAVGIGVSVHEGRLFGPLNVLMNALAAVSLAVVAVSGTVMWWRRRPAGRLGAPPGPVPALARPALAAIALLAVLLPLFGISLALVVAIDRLVLRRIGFVADFLGLRHPRETG